MSFVDCCSLVDARCLLFAFCLMRLVYCSYVLLVVVCCVLCVVCFVCLLVVVCVLLVAF